MNFAMLYLLYYYYLSITSNTHTIPVFRPHVGLLVLPTPQAHCPMYSMAIGQLHGGRDLTYFHYLLGVSVSPKI